MIEPSLRLGLALSGGGVRALVFHLGLLERLARQNLLQSVRYISTVSGGSLAAGLIFTLANSRWPDAKEYRSTILPACKSLLTTRDLQRRYVVRLLCIPWLLARGRAHVLARAMQKTWKVTGTLAQLSDEPVWFINATTYETGKNWRFSKKRMGDYQTHYVLMPHMPLADAMAASAAVPGLIGPLSIKTCQHKWQRYLEESHIETQPVSPVFSRLRLWDGGVYDNLGVEALFKRSSDGLREGIDFLIVSDASRPLAHETGTLQTGFPFYKPPFRLIDVATDQSRALRSRDLVEFFSGRGNCGVYSPWKHGRRYFQEGKVRPA
jgi:NTE family protein